MVKHALVLAVAAGAICAVLTSNAQATTLLSGSLTADNAFFAYLSTTPAAPGAAPGTFGALISSGNNWRSAATFSGVALNPGVNYLNIEVVNFSDASYPSNPGALLGTFTYGGQTLETDTLHWSASYNNANANSSPQSWQPAIDPVTSLGANSDTSTIWYGVNGGSIAKIDPTAQWIDASVNGLDNQICQNNGCTVDFTTEIFVSAPGPTPGAGLFSLAFFVAAGLITRARASRP